MGLNQDCSSLVNGNPWRNPYSNPYVYDAATAVALVGYGPYAAGLVIYIHFSNKGL